jgi:hypothetical protein
MALSELHCSASRNVESLPVGNLRVQGGTGPHQGEQGGQQGMASGGPFGRRRSPFRAARGGSATGNRGWKGWAGGSGGRPYVHGETDGWRDTLPLVWPAQAVAFSYKVRHLSRICHPHFRLAQKRRSALRPIALCMTPAPIPGLKGPVPRTRNGSRRSKACPGACNPGPSDHPHWAAGTISTGSLPGTRAAPNKRGTGPRRRRPGPGD